MRIKAISILTSSLHLLSQATDAMEPQKDPSISQKQSREILTDQVSLTPKTDNEDKLLTQMLQGFTLEGVTGTKVRDDLSVISLALRKKYGEDYIDLIAPLFTRITDMFKGVPNTNIEKGIKLWHFNKVFQPINKAFNSIQETHRVNFINLVSPVLSGCNVNDRCQIIKLFSSIEESQRIVYSQFVSLILGKEGLEGKELSDSISIIKEMSENKSKGDTCIKFVTGRF